MRIRVPFAVSATLSILFVAVPAFAADFTDLVDAADDKDDLIDETYDGFDFNIEPSFVMDFGSATITREAVCVPDESDLVGEASKDFHAGSPRLEIDRTRCSEARVVDNNEAEYKRQTMTMNLDLKAGLYKDLEIHLNIPYVINDVQGMRYAQGVSAANSSIDPSDSRIRDDAEDSFDGGQGRDGALNDLDFYSTYRYFDLEDDFVDFSRSGFADPTLGLHWAPFNDYRDDTKATLVVGMDYQLPLAPTRLADNEAVGSGMHELSWLVASSKRFDFIEPYFGLQYFLPLPAPRSPIRQLDSGNDGQVFLAPPQRGEITIGTEFIPYDDPETGARYGFDLQFKFGYTSEGRDYTPLFEHMTRSDCVGKSLDDVLPTYDADGNLQDIGDVECAWVARQPSNAPEFGGEPDPIYDLSRVPSGENPEFENFDGIMTVESYGTWAGRFGVLLQPSHYFQFKAHVALTHQQEHFLTNARTGRDVADSQETTPDDTVDLEGPDAELEKNPVFNPTYDSNGQRFRVQQYNTWTIFLTAALKF